jgi:hypothetical protein
MDFINIVPRIARRDSGYRSQIPPEVITGWLRPDSAGSAATAVIAGCDAGGPGRLSIGAVAEVGDAPQASPMWWQARASAADTVNPVHAGPFRLVPRAVSVPFRSGGRDRDCDREALRLR